MPKFAQSPAGNFSVLCKMDDNEGPDNNSINPFSSLVESDCLGKKINIEGSPEFDTKSPSGC